MILGDQIHIQRIKEKIQRSFANTIAINDFQLGQKAIMHNVTKIRVDSRVSIRTRKKSHLLIVDPELIKDAAYKAGLDLTKVLILKAQDILS